MGVYIKGMSKPKKGEVVAFDGEYAVYTDDDMQVHRYPLIEIVTCGECKYQYMCGHQIKRNGLTLKLTCCEYGERRAE